MATMRDVANAAGVSTATVSRVINGNGVVAPALAERVRVAVDALNYRPNLVARGLRNQATSVLALVFSDIENEFFTSVCRGVEDHARKFGYSVMVCNADEDVQKESEYVAVLASQSVAGVIISPASDHTDVSQLLQRRVPVVALDRALPYASDSVHSDSRNGAREATAHLIAGGARRVGCVTGPAEVSTAHDRLMGYREALVAAGMVTEDVLEGYGDFREAGGYLAAKKLLSQPNPPDALFVANNRMMLGVLRACRETGLRIPDDVSLVGFDDLPWADYVSPPITTVRQPTYDLGTAAAKLLLERIAGTDAPPREIVLRPELVIRASSIKPKVEPHRASGKTQEAQAAPPALTSSNRSNPCC
jgi:LacI family transcriptional regulator